jgi:hypothetical protein
MKTFSKVVLGLGFLVLMPLGAYASIFLNPITIEGKIVDSMTGEPIKDARITSKTFKDSLCSRYVFDCGYEQDTGSAISGKDGAFSLRIPKLPPGLVGQDLWTGDMLVTADSYIPYEKSLLGAPDSHYALRLVKKYLENLPQGTIKVALSTIPGKVYLNLTHSEIVATLDDADIILEYSAGGLPAEKMYKQYLLRASAIPVGKKIYLTHIYSNGKGGIIPIEENHLRKFEEINDCSKMEYRQEIELLNARENYGFKDGTRIFCVRQPDGEHFAKVLIDVFQFSFSHTKKIDAEYYDHIHFVYQPHGSDLGSAITEPSINAAMRGPLSE